MNTNNYVYSRWEAVCRMTGGDLALHILWWQATAGLLSLLMVLPIGLFFWLNFDTSLRMAACGSGLFALLVGLAGAYRYSRLPKQAAQKAIKEGIVEAWHGH